MLSLLCKEENYAGELGYSMLTRENFDFLKVLACPICGGKLNQVNALRICKRSHSYPVIYGIPHFCVIAKDLDQFELHKRAKLDESYITSYLSEQIPLHRKDMLPVGDAIRDSLILDLLFQRDRYFPFFLSKNPANHSTAFKVGSQITVSK